MEHVDEMTVYPPHPMTRERGLQDGFWHWKALYDNDHDGSFRKQQHFWPQWIGSALGGEVHNQWMHMSHDCIVSFTIEE
jgi:hypothetical protein